MQKRHCKYGICTIFCIFGTDKKNEGQNAPYYQLEKLPPLREKVETIEILRQTNKSTAALAELKGIARQSLIKQYENPTNI